MKISRAIMGYFAACVAASYSSFFVGLIIKFGPEALIETPKWLGKRGGVLLITAGVIGIVMLIPSLIFIALSRKKQGPGMLACLAFGGLSGSLIMALLLIGGNGGAIHIERHIYLVISFGIGGLFGGLMFWWVAMWGRSSELPESSR